MNYFYSHGSRYFEVRQRDGVTLNPLDNPGYVSPALTAITGTPPSAGIAFPPPSSRRAMPALFLQGNRDVLFNLTDAYFNYRYFKDAGGDVRLLTTEGGHMNPLVQQIEGTANCGGVIGVDAILAWFDEKLKGAHSATFAAIPQVCISVTPTPAAGAAPANGALSAVRLADVPVGSLTGAGAVPAVAATLQASVPALSGGTPVFVKVLDITVPGGATAPVLAGIPTADRINISAGTGSLLTPVAYVGVGIVRGGSTILVDDMVTAFAGMAPATSSTMPGGCAAPTDHCFNRGLGNFAPNAPIAAQDRVLLPGVGEQLQDGDQVGLLFYENHAQFLPVNNAGTAAQTGLPNPYDVTLTNVRMPILVPGAYPGSSLSVP
jgi:ABC-2 type transport system ATP-binding protein